MKRAFIPLLLLFALSACASRTDTTADSGADGIFQLGTFNGLLAGALEGTVTYGELEKHGDFGTGTFDGLDGEMWAMDGRFYRIQADGTAAPADPGITSPFIALKKFRPDQTEQISAPRLNGTQAPLPCAELYRTLDSKLPTLNVPYAVHVSGRFEYVKTRSVAKKQKPYPSADEIIRSQVEKEWTGVEGDMVGFRFPAYLAGTQMPGYHLHFLNTARTNGGHVLDCRISDVTVRLDRASGVRIAYPPGGGEYDRVDLGPKAK